MNLQWLEYGRNPVQRWLHRRRWWLRAAIAMAAVPWLGWYGWSRWTAEPVASTGFQRVRYAVPAAACPDADVNQTDALLAALEALPQPPSRRPAADGWRDSGGWNDLSAMLNLPWDSRDPYLQEVRRYLEEPATREALQRIRALSEEPFCFQAAGLTGEADSIHRAAMVLVTRARMRVAEDGDYAAAGRDLKALLSLAAELENDRTLVSVLVALPCRTLAMRELLLWCQEYDSSPTEIAILSEVTASHEFDPEELWRRILANVCAARVRALDHLYTRSSDGGHLVPAAVYANGEPAHPIMRAVNLLSFAFPDRRRAEACIRGYYERARDFTPAQAMARMDAFGRLYVLISRTSVYHRGARVALALERYRHDRGHYPQTLAALVPETLRAIPRDPFDRQPLRYRLGGDGTYRLWSVGANGTDESARRFRSQARRSDLVLPHRRGEKQNDGHNLDAPTRIEAGDC